ncbi:MAG: hypothetical protein LBK99_25770 [Opitutaceae bacterium]|jgi:hypothetical protein|nr:hypothetical protein [Opitutaceae bacterium]
MVKTQVQLPDHLYTDAKRVASEYEMSFAEVVRRGLERFLESYPPSPKPLADWHPPVSAKVGWKGLDHAAIHSAALDDQEPRLAPDGSGKH